MTLTMLCSIGYKWSESHHVTHTIQRILIYLFLAVFMYTYSFLVVVHCAEITSIVFRSLDYTIACTVILCTSAIDTGLLSAAQCAKLIDLTNTIQWIYPSDVYLSDPELKRFYDICMRRWTAHTDGDALMRAVTGALLTIGKTIQDHPELLAVKEYSQLVNLVEWYTGKPKV